MGINYQFKEMLKEEMGKPPTDQPNRHLERLLKEFGNGPIGETFAWAIHTLVWALRGLALPLLSNHLVDYHLSFVLEPLP